MKKIVTLFSTAILVSCTPVQKHVELAQPIGQELSAGVGEIVYKSIKTRDMHNAYGNADIFGRKVDEGYEEIRYLGLKNTQQPNLHIRT